MDTCGERFISTGVNAVRLESDAIKGTTVTPYASHSLATYGTPEGWRRAVSDQLHGWGFNTLGAWSESEVAQAGSQPLWHCGIINFCEAFVRRQAGAGSRGAWLSGTFPDVFDPAFAELACEIAQEHCRSYAADPSLLGWFLDNELRWGADWRNPLELLPVFLNLGKEQAGAKAAWAFVQEHLCDVAHFNRIWKSAFGSWEEAAAATAIPAPWTRAPRYLTDNAKEHALNAEEPAREQFFAICDAFLGLVAEAYFSATARALKSAAPGQLNLGCRFAYVPAEPVIAAAARYVDVISFNCYENDPLPVIEAYGSSGRPLLVGEFSFRSEDSGLPNTIGAGPWVKTQQERARAFETYVGRALSHPCVVGYHWFKHADQPREGRFDGENSNYGIVKITGESYATFAAAVTRVNAKHSKPRCQAALRPLKRAAQRRPAK